MTDGSNRIVSWLFNAAALISLVLTILIASGVTPLYSVVASPLIAAFLIMAAILVARFVEWKNSRPKVTYYRSLQEIPKYKIANMLTSIKAGKVTKLEVIARTGFRLLAGDEEHYRKDPNVDSKKTSRYFKIVTLTVSQAEVKYTSSFRILTSKCLTSATLPMCCSKNKPLLHLKAMTPYAQNLLIQVPKERCSCQLLTESS